MPKGIKKSGKKSSIAKDNIGRPTDDGLETFFMNKLRGTKLQLINS